MHDFFKSCMNIKQFPGCKQAKQTVVMCGLDIESCDKLHKQLKRAATNHFKNHSNPQNICEESLQLHFRKMLCFNAECGDFFTDVQWFDYL